ncbi:MAG: 7-cyano-7-deazaguanine synthase QueC [Bacteroidales bacterium]
MKSKNCLVLFSGGLDSSTLLAYTINKGYKVTALTFNYEQRHIHELSCAKKLAKIYNIENHIIQKIDLKKFNQSALTNIDIAVPKGRDINKIDDEIPATYVPLRNLIFLTYAAAWCEKYFINDLFIGVNSIDYSNYPDCRSKFVKGFEKVVNLGSKFSNSLPKLKIHAPLINLQKFEIINLGNDLGLDFSLTSTCYDPKPNGKPCCGCDACLIRENGFTKAGMIDPLLNIKPFLQAHLKALQAEAQTKVR